MKIYSGIKDENGNIPWIDDETGEQGADANGSSTLNLKYKRTVKKFTENELADDPWDTGELGRDEEFVKVDESLDEELAQLLQ